jgi:GNAT superfamily N-acetyltransferase
MSRTSSRIDLTIRAYTDRDEEEVLDLLRASLGEGPGGERSADFFRWKHLENPFGPSFMLVAQADGRIVGLRAFMRWRFLVQGRPIEAVRAVDTATHPHFQGRGVFSRLTREALVTLGREADLVFNTPNKKSLPGYVKMGWTIVGRVPIQVRIRRPLRFARGVRATRERALAPGGRPEPSAPRAAEILEDPRVQGLLRRAVGEEDRLATPRTLEFLEWRYGLAPLLDYRVVTLEEDGRLKGLAIFRVRSRGAIWESTVSDVIVPPGDGPALRRLIRKVGRAAPVDHVTCRLPALPSRAALRSGLVPAPGGITLAVNTLREGIRPDPTDLRSWGVSLGDLEVF